ncbi:MAG: sialidase family protein, partial [Candidatus Methylomirabilales bacterium]
MMTRKWTILGPILGLFLMASFGDAAFLKPSPDSKAGSVHPRLSVGPGGPIYLVWAEERDGRPQDLFFNRSTDQGKTWQKEDRWLDQDKPAGSRSSAPQIHSDGKGHVYVVWRTKHQDGRKDILFTASKDFGATFGPKRKLNREGGAFAPEISADGKGHVYVVWSDERAEGKVGGEEKKKHASHNIYFNRSDDHGESW